MAEGLFPATDEARVAAAASRLSQDQAALQRLEGAPLFGYAWARREGRRADLATVQAYADQMAEFAKVQQEVLDEYVKGGSPDDMDLGRFLQTAVRVAARHSENPLAQKMFNIALVRYHEYMMDKAKLDALAKELPAKPADAKNFRPNEHQIAYFRDMVMPDIQDMVKRQVGGSQEKQGRISARAADAIARHAFEFFVDQHVYAENMNFVLDRRRSATDALAIAEATTVLDPQTESIRILDTASKFISELKLDTDNPNPDALRRVQKLRIPSSIPDAKGRPIPLGWWTFRDAWARIDSLARAVEKRAESAVQERTEAAKAGRRFLQRKREAAVEEALPLDDYRDDPMRGF